MENFALRVHIALVILLKVIVRPLHRFHAELLNELPERHFVDTIICIDLPKSVFSYIALPKMRNSENGPSRRHVFLDYQMSRSG